MNLSEAKLFSLRFPCPSCAEKISKNNIKYVKARHHKASHDLEGDGPLKESIEIFNKAGVVYEAGEPVEL